MALTGKTIGQLTYLSGVTTDTLFPVELSGETYHIAYSAFTNSNYNEGTYEELYSLSTGGTLTAGSYYLMTDFQTCYDQPNFDHDGNPITTGNYKTGATEPILLLATSTTGFSPTVFSTLYPKDKITYDITWNLTEVTSNPAKGRITERIDDRNNRADYDFRNVQFIRYVGYFSETISSGKLTLDGSTGLVTGTGTFFTSDFIVGNPIGVFYGTNNNQIGAFVYYEITQIDSDTSMYVSGKNLYYATDTYYSQAVLLPNHSSPFQCNISGGSNDEYTEYYTFNNNQNYNTYLGDNQNYDTFILSNNVFKNGSYRNNTFGGNVIGNTFDDDMDSITTAPFFQYNIITNDFDQNTVGPYFQKNIIDSDMRGNQIGELFQYNTIGDDDAYDFDYNVIGTRFQGNFFTFTNNDFATNIIGDSFRNNRINAGFISNNIGNSFENNDIVSNNFNQNTIRNSFNGNTIKSTFEKNQIGESFNANIIYSIFNNNIVGYNFNTNTFGDPTNIEGTIFQFNNFGANTQSNYFSGNTENNVVGNNFTNNNLDYNFSFNKISDFFQYNTIGHDFGFGGSIYRGNVIGNGFASNTVGEYCYDNTFGDNCTSNNLSNYFTNNKISFGMNNTTIVDLDTAGNFQNNTITYGYFSQDLTLTGGVGGNPVFYSSIPTNVTLDYVDASGYVTFLSGGTIVTQTIIV